MARYVKKIDRALVKAGVNVRYYCTAAVTVGAPEQTTIDEGMPFEQSRRVNPVYLVDVDVTDSDSWDDVADLARAYVERVHGVLGYSVRNVHSERKLKVYM